jgi:hypothetical protein
MLTGCGGETAVEKLAKERNLQPLEAAAIDSCLTVSKSRSVSTKSADKTVRYQKIPLLLCACQAPEMIKVFTEEGMPEHDKIIRAFSDEPAEEPIKPEMLIEGQTPASAKSRLEGSFKSCMIKTKRELHALTVANAKKRSQKGSKDQEKTN